MNAVVDTNIFIDFVSGKKPFADNALRFFKESMQCKHFVYLTDAVIYELEGKKVLEEVSKIILTGLKNKGKLVFLEATPQQKENAKKISTEQGISYADALIALLAKENTCIVLTRDKHFKQNLSFLIDSFKPEDLV